MMKTERFEIKNRYGLKLVIQVDTPENPKNLVFIAPRTRWLYRSKTYSGIRRFIFRE